MYYMAQVLRVLLGSEPTS